MTAKPVCRHCDQRWVTWEESRRQFGILINGGLTKEQINDLRPMCAVCARKLRKDVEQGKVA